jgi:type VI protein secretion system component Hcp
MLADSAEAGKVSMQDFHFVSKQNKASPKLMTADGAEAGKVSMQDFHFVIKVNKASPKLS